MGNRNTPPGKAPDRHAVSRSGDRLPIADPGRGVPMDLTAQSAAMCKAVAC